MFSCRPDASCSPPARAAIATVVPHPSLRLSFGKDRQTYGRRASDESHRGLRHRLRGRHVGGCRPDHAELAEVRRRSALLRAWAGRGRCGGARAPLAGATAAVAFASPADADPAGSGPRTAPVEREGAVVEPSRCVVRGGIARARQVRARPWGSSAARTCSRCSSTATTRFICRGRPACICPAAVRCFRKCRFGRRRRCSRPMASLPIRRSSLMLKRDSPW